MNMEKKTILMVDDHKILIEGIRNMLPDDKFVIVDGTTSAFEALEIIKTCSIDILITDIRMPGMNGIELIKTIRELNLDIKIIVLSMFNDKYTVIECVQLGIDAYISKNISCNELLKALEKITENKYYFSDEFSDMIVKEINQKNTNSILTPREKEILALVANEFSNSEIADKLFISERTVESHRKNIYRKTGQETLVGLIKYAIDNNLTDFNIRAAT